MKDIDPSLNHSNADSFGTRGLDNYIEHLGIVHLLQGAEMNHRGTSMDEVNDGAKCCSIVNDCLLMPFLEQIWLKQKMIPGCTIE
jgi:hypothetical protein